MFWLSLAAATSSVVGQLAAFARAADLAPDEQGTPERADRSSAEGWLGQFGNSPETLLILDNLEEPAPYLHLR